MWHRMTRMTGPDCAVLRNLMNIYTHTHTHKHTNMQTHTHTNTHTHKHTTPRGLAGIPQQRTTALVAVVASRVACSHRKGRGGGGGGGGGAVAPFSFSGQEFTCRLCGPGGTLWATGGRFWAGFGSMDRTLPGRDSNGPASMAEREGRAKGGTASGGKVRLGDNPSRQLGLLPRTRVRTPPRFLVLS